MTPVMGRFGRNAAIARVLVVHLRLHFQLLLAPVYLWGWLIAGGGWSPQVVVGFVAFHFFLYSGATAFNSYFDRDVGPVGGLEHPPEVPRGLLALSLAMKAIGWLLAACVNLPFFAAYGIFVVLSVAYSHPSIRWKAHTLLSLFVVGFGQGALAFLAAWAATRGEVASAVNRDGLFGASAAVFLILALYPLTQLYQTEEDAARGDRTVVVAWGASAAFGFALVSAALGGAAMLALVLARFGAIDAGLVGIGVLGELAVLFVWRARFNPVEVIQNYRRVMRLNTASAAALGSYLIVRLALGR